MRALLIWGSFTLCILAVAVSSSDPSESAKDEGPQKLAALVGKENGGRRKELSDWLADSPSVAEVRAATPRKLKRRKCVGCFTALIVNDDAGAGKRQKKKIPGKRTNANIARSLIPRKDKDGIEKGDCNLMPPREVVPFDTSSRKSKRERRHAEDGHGRHHKHGKKRDEERRGRKRECKPKEEEPTKTLEPELSSVDGQVKEKRRHRGHDRERGHREKWRSGSTSSIAIAPPSSTNTEPGDGKPWWTERSRKRRQNDKNRRPQNRPRPGWGGAIAGVKPIKPWWTELSRKRRQNDRRNRKPNNIPRPGWGSSIASVDPRKNQGQTWV